MVAVLWVTYIINGMKTYEGTPRLLKAQVKELLILAGFEHLVTEGDK